MKIYEIIVLAGLTAAAGAGAYLYASKYLKQRLTGMLICMPICLVGLVVEAVLNRGGGFLESLTLISAVAGCFCAAWIDAKTKLIPNPLVLTLLGVRILLYIAEFISDFDAALYGLKSDGIALLIVAIFGIIGAVMIRNGMGMGDIKLLLVLALYAGADIIFALLFFTLVAAFVWAIYLLLFKKAGRSTELPFAPFILFGCIVTTVLQLL